MRQLAHCCAFCLVVSVWRQARRPIWARWFGPAARAAANYNDANNWQVVNPLNLPTPTGAANRVPISLLNSRDEQAYIYNGASVTVSADMTAKPINQLSVGGGVVLDANGNPLGSTSTSLTMVAGGTLLLNSIGGGYFDDYNFQTVPYAADFTVGGTFGGTLNMRGGLIKQVRGTYDVVSSPSFTIGTDTGNTTTPAVLNFSGGSISRR